MGKLGREITLASGPNGAESSPALPRLSPSSTLMTLRKVEDFLEQKRRKEKEEAKEAYLALRTQKREPKALQTPLVDETWGRMTAEFREMRQKAKRNVCKAGWR